MNIRRASLLEEVELDLYAMIRLCKDTRRGLLDDLRQSEPWALSCKFSVDDARLARQRALFFYAQDVDR